eukprot:COSAG02_NODE_261_length_26663_cov_210.330899_9_plen_83_part_00
MMQSVREQGASGGEDIEELIEDIREYHKWVKLGMDTAKSGSARQLATDDDWHSARNLKIMRRKRWQRKASKACRVLGRMLCH